MSKTEAQQDAQGQKQRPDSQWYARMIQNTLDDDFVIGPPPPAQRVMLTDDEIEETMRDYVDVENGLFKVHKALIEAYEKKNGTNRG